MDEIGMDNIIKYLDDDHPGRKIDLTDNTSQFLFFYNYFIRMANTSFEKK